MTTPDHLQQRRLRTYTDLAATVLAQPPRRGSSRIVGVNGGSAAGKSTFARRLARALDAPVVHTDDVAWWESFFDWWPLLVEGILDPLADGQSVAFRPPAWERRGREGAITVSPAPAIVVEGVGATRRELANHLDIAIWIDTDRQVAFDRGLARQGEDLAFWREWEEAEEAHFAEDHPWDRADVLISADPPSPPEPEVAFWEVTAASWRREDRPVGDGPAQGAVT